MLQRPILLSATILIIAISFMMLPLSSSTSIAADVQTAPSLTPTLGLVPHKALYEIKMTSRSSGAPIVNISGEMFYEWKPSCDAWTTDHRFNLMYEYSDSAPLRITSNFSTYENYDGKSFDYTSRRMRNGDLYEELRGQALMNDNNTGEAVYSLPEGLVFNLQDNTMFPMAHTVELLRLIGQDRRFFSAVVFDGSDDEGPVEINTFIGAPVNVMGQIEMSPAIDPSLINVPAHKVRMAFFPVLEPDADAEYEMDMFFHENGVISDMHVEYREFSVRQSLKALEKLPLADCPAE